MNRAALIRPDDERRRLIMVKTILVVDDEPDMLEFLAALLEDNGYLTMTASDGDEALAKVKTAKPDLVSLDLVMPNETGSKLFLELRSDPDTAHIPVVLVTGLSRDAFHQAEFDGLVRKHSLKPPEACVEKPVDALVLLDTLKNVIAGG
jgi:CheY-like chemotaxis protein